MPILTLRSSRAESIRGTGSAKGIGILCVFFHARIVGKTYKGRRKTEVASTPEMILMSVTLSICHSLITRLSCPTQVEAAARRLSRAPKSLAKPRGPHAKTGGLNGPPALGQPRKGRASRSRSANAPPTAFDLHIMCSPRDNVARPFNFAGHSLDALVFGICPTNLTRSTPR
jgi:hypothetical protein